MRLHNIGAYGIQAPMTYAAERYEVQHQPYPENGYWLSRTSGQEFESESAAQAHIDEMSPTDPWYGKPTRIVRVTHTDEYEVITPPPAGPPTPVSRAIERIWTKTLAQHLAPFLGDERYRYGDHDS